MNRKLLYETKNYSILFEESLSTRYFMDFDEFNPNGLSTVTDKQSFPGMDGVCTYQTTFGERVINIKAKALLFNIGNKRKSVTVVSDELKNYISLIFNPKKSGTLKYTNFSGSYFIECRPISIPAFSNSTEFENTLGFSVDLYSDGSYWNRSEEHSVIIGEQDGTLQLPAILPSNFSQMTNLVEEINNLSGLPTYPIIQIFPCSSSPVIVNETTGKHIALNSGISNGYYVEINTVPEKQTVSLMQYDASVKKYLQVDNVEYWLSADSDIDFSISPGKNVISINNTAAASKVARLTWHEQVLAV